MRVAAVRPIVGVVGSSDAPLHLRRSVRSLVIVTGALLAPLGTVDTFEERLIGVAAGRLPRCAPTQSRQPIKAKARRGTPPGLDRQLALRRRVERCFQDDA